MSPKKDLYILGIVMEKRPTKAGLVDQRRGHETLLIECRPLSNGAGTKVRRWMP